MLPALIGGLATLGSAGLGMAGQSEANSANRKMFDDSQLHNVAMAKMNQRYLTDISNTAYQRSMADMKAAGLNPMLAFSQGGASTPSGGGSSGSSAPGAQNELSGATEAVGRTISSAIEQRRLKKEIEATSSQISLNDAAKLTQGTQQELNSNSAAKAKAEAERSRYEAQAIKARLPAIKAGSKVEEKQSEYDLKAAPVDAILKRVGSVLGAGHSAAGIVGKAAAARGYTIQEGSRRETEALHRAGSRGLPVRRRLP